MAGNQSHTCCCADERREADEHEGVAGVGDRFQERHCRRDAHQVQHEFQDDGVRRPRGAR